jgi:hypothetical protein
MHIFITYILIYFTFLSQEYFLPVQTGLHTPVAFGAHFFRTVLKSKVSINLYCHQSGLHTPVVFGTHFAGAAVGDQCFTLQDDFQRPLPFFCLTFSVGSKSTGTALSNPSYLSKQATYPYVRSWTHISPG